MVRKTMRKKKAMDKQEKLRAYIEGWVAGNIVLAVFFILYMVLLST